MISESKIDYSIPDSQFFLDGYSTPYRLDQNRNGGVITLFVRNDILPKMISIEKLPTESFLIELNLRKKRWLINCSYNTNNGNIESRLDSVSKSLDIHFVSNMAKGRISKRLFFGKFGVLCILVTSVLRFALLPYHRRFKQI